MIKFSAQGWIYPGMEFSARFLKAELKLQTGVEVNLRVRMNTFS